MPRPLQIAPKKMFQNPFKAVRLTVALTFYFIIFSAKAQIYNGAVATSTGGSGRAAVEAGDSVYLNPGTLVYLRGRSLHSSFVGNDFAVSISDNDVESVLPAAFSYVQKEVPNTKYKQKDMSLTLGSFVKGKLAMGVTAHVYELVHPTGTINQVNTNLGFTYVANANLGLGFVAYDIAGAKKEMPDYLQLRPRTAVGLNYVYKTFARFRFDVESANSNDWSTAKYMTGFESYLSQWVIFRLGYYQIAKSDQGFGTFGVGFSGPQFSMNYAYQERSEISEEARHSIDLVIPF